jgi:RHS repeat-associated protein
MEQDTEASLYDFPAREYEWQGRWPSPDPAGFAAVDPTNPQSWNRYAYVLNNPLMYIDPLGMNVCAPNNNSGPSSNNPSCFHGVSSTMMPGDYPVFGFVGMSGGSLTFVIGDIGTSMNVQSTGITNLIFADSPFSPVNTSYAIGGNTSGSMTWLQTKVFLQALGRNFVDEFKPGGCVNAFGKATADALNPFSPSLSSAGEGTAVVLAASKYNAAVQYAASAPNYLGGTGLIYPMKSSVVRSMVADANATAASGGLMTLDLALAQGFATEMYDMATGSCH